jgi:hypothetical protein
MANVGQAAKAHAPTPTLREARPHVSSLPSDSQRMGLQYADVMYADAYEGLK